MFCPLHTFDLTNSKGFIKACKNAASFPKRKSFDSTTLLREIVNRRNCSVQVLKKASEKQALVEVALNTHGTRAVQKLIETLSSPEQVSLASQQSLDDSQLWMYA